MVSKIAFITNKTGSIHSEVQPGIIGGVLQGYVSDPVRIKIAKWLASSGE